MTETTQKPSSKPKTKTTRKRKTKEVGLHKTARKNAVAQEKWAEARRLFETDPKETLGTLAERLGVSRQAVSQKSQKENWKRLVSPEQLAVKAKAIADRRTVDSYLDLEDAEKHREQGLTDAVDRRALILERHRSEINLARREIYNSLKEKDFEGLKRGKITAEALQIIQNAERKSWGLDINPDSDDDKVVIVERTS